MGTSAWRRTWPYLIAVLFGLSFFAMTHLEFDGVQPPVWLVPIDLVAGTAAIVALHWRHRFPVLVMVLTNVTSCLGGLSGGAWMIATGSMATRRRRAEAVLAVGCAVASAWVSDLFYPSGGVPVWVMVTMPGLMCMAVLGFGWYVGARRDLLASYRERAETAEREQTRREAQARVSERATIAREMHDVLAHRISLLAMHAGALSYRRDLTPEQTREIASVLQHTAHQALDELRGVLATLRDGGLVDGEPVERPQPTLADLDALVADAGAAGASVRVRDELPRAAGVPDRLGRDVYRIVQEALTNARKHAPGVPVQVQLTGAPGADLVVEVANPLPTYVGSAPARGVPGAGLGLIGLSERAGLAGGGLRHGPTPDGRYVVRAWLPWAEDHG